MNALLSGLGSGLAAAAGLRIICWIAGFSVIEPWASGLIASIGGFVFIGVAMFVAMEESGC